VEMSRVPPLALLEKITEARDHPGSSSGQPVKNKKETACQKNSLIFKSSRRRNRGVASRRAAAYLCASAGEKLG
jgi:hypothetical protein